MATRRGWIKSQAVYIMFHIIYDYYKVYSLQVLQGVIFEKREVMEHGVVAMAWFFRYAQNHYLVARYRSLQANKLRFARLGVLSIDNSLIVG